MCMSRVDRLDDDEDRNIRFKRVMSHARWALIQGMMSYNLSQSLAEKVLVSPTNKEVRSATESRCAACTSVLDLSWHASI